MMTPSAADAPRSSIRVGFVVRGVLFASIILSVTLPFIMGFVFAATLTAPICGGGADPARYDLTFDSLTVPAPSFNADVRAYFIYADNVSRDVPTPTIIAMPTGAQGRADRLHELIAFTRAGYHVFAPESQTCATASPNTLGYREAAMMGDMLAYLNTRPDVDANKLGIHGFSAGGAAAILAAARYPQIRAVIAQGGYHDFHDEVTTNTRGYDRLLWFGDVFRFGAEIGYRLTTGLEMRVLNPVSVIASIAPRPILLIYGSREPGLRGAQIQRAAAGDTAELWVIEGAGHGNYTAYAPNYAQRVVAFMDAGLSAP